MKAGKIFPVLFGFFVMGFVDVVGIAVSYIQSDFELSDTMANTLPMAVFLWFVLLSIPTGVFMQKYGKKKTVFISLMLTFIAMVLPMLQYSFPILLIAFGLLGVGNTILQVSLNPLLASIVGDKYLTSALTLGQFIKALSSFLGPIIVSLAVIYAGSWKWLFPLYAVTTLLSLVWLSLSVPASLESGQSTTFKDVISLLKERDILYAFIGILTIVGIDVGLNTVIPKLLIEKTDIPLNEAGLGNSIYFGARTIGTFVGTVLLIRFRPGYFLQLNMGLALACFVFLIFAEQLFALKILIAGIGFVCSNVFPILFSYALQYKPEKNNEISALMIMGVSGGALVPPIMGAIADYSTQAYSLVVLTIGVVYLFGFSIFMQKCSKVS